MKLTLEQTWRECLRMWKYVAAKATKGCDVPGIKERWCEDRGIHPHCECFFCEYACARLEGKTDFLYNRCSHCPGRKVDPEFDCFARAYSWEARPKTFYRKLVALNRKRVATKERSKPPRRKRG
jgi:hypothetical protein